MIETLQGISNQVYVDKLICYMAITVLNKTYYNVNIEISFRFVLGLFEVFYSPSTARQLSANHRGRFILLYRDSSHDNTLNLQLQSQNDLFEKDCSMKLGEHLF